jgi:hypothetical protein
MTEEGLENFKYHGRLSNREPKPGHFPRKDRALSLYHELLLTTVVVVDDDDDGDDDTCWEQWQNEY